MKNRDLSKGELKSIFKYKNGELFWKKRKSPNSPKGAKAGRPDDRGYIRVCIDGIDYKCHRIVYIMHRGPIPPGLQVDHRNEMKSDNRIRNLRLATNAQNKSNTSKRSDNTSGCIGVSWKVANNKWQASICIGGYNKYIGVFVKKVDAIEAYKKASIENHKKFSRFINQV